MSKSSKKISKEKNLQKKRAKKAAMRAMYDSWTIAGANRKSKRSISHKKKGHRANTISHPEGACGNIGCKRCDPAGIHGGIPTIKGYGTNENKVKIFPLLA